MKTSQYRNRPPKESRSLTTLMLACLLILGSACSKEDDSGKQRSVSQDSKAATADESINEAQQTESGIDYPALYCEHVGQLALRADVSEELAFACRDASPTPEFYAFRKKALDQAPGEIEIVLLKAEHANDSDLSTFKIAWGFHVPIRPFEVKNRPIYEFIAKGFTKDDITMAASNERLPDDQLDHGLHLWSVNMHYDLTVRGGAGLDLTNSRNTQYNLYQVQSGNEEMGFGVEALINEDNPDYLKSTMLNLSFNDGNGYNDGNGGAVVVTILDFAIKNQGFPATATDSVKKIAEHIAQEMYNGLKE